MTSNMDPSLKKFLLAGNLAVKHQTGSSSSGGTSSFASSALQSQTLQKPSNYIPGAGRGAVGFTTASDIGPALNPSDILAAAVSGKNANNLGSVPGGLSNKKNVASFGTAPAGYIPGAGRGYGGFGEAKPNAAAINEDRGDYSDGNFDKFGGFGESLFAGVEYTDEDREADMMWKQVDDGMAERSSKRKKISVDSENGNAKNKSISEMFADLKQEMLKVPAHEFASIPDAVVQTSRAHLENKNKNTKRNSLTSVSDNMIMNTVASSSASSGFSTSISDGMATTLSEARQKIFSVAIDRTDAATGGYSTAIGSMSASQTSGLQTQSFEDTMKNALGVSGLGVNLQDTKKLRKLLQSIVNTNPTFGAGWIAFARLEERVGQLADARKIIREACSVCKYQEDVWLEAAKLHKQKEEASLILQRGLEFNPKSISLWIELANLEFDPTKPAVNQLTGEPLDETLVKSMKNKRMEILRNSVSKVPNSTRLWKELVELEDDKENAKVLLRTAVKWLPQSVDMWISLAKLETIENSRKVLNEAREHMPTERKIWIAALQFEEKNGSELKRLDAMFQKALKILSDVGVQISREQWIKDAEDSEHDGFPSTSAAIINATIGLKVDPQDQLRTWLDDAETVESHNRPETARAILRMLEKGFAKEEDMWIKIFKFEKKYGNRETSRAAMERALDEEKGNPESEILWLMAAKEEWVSGDVPRSREILKRATEHEEHGQSESIWLAAAKLEFENNFYDAAENILSKARGVIENSPRIWMKSIALERELCYRDLLRSTQKEEQMLIEATNKFPTFAKLWMMYVQLKQRTNNIQEAKDICTKALKFCEGNAVLWIMAAKLEENNPAKARAKLASARAKLPNNEMIWLESFRLEMKHGEEKLAETLMASGLKQLPNSGALWAEKVEVAGHKHNQHKKIALDAYEKCEKDARVLTAIAKKFWKERKFDKAQNWFEKAVQSNLDNGDAWGWYYKFALAIETTPGSNLENAVASETVKDRCVEADPKHGEVWASTRKHPLHRPLKTDQILFIVSQKLELQ